jgi:hypothetical protein
MNRPRLAPLLLILAFTLQLAWYSLLVVEYVRTPRELVESDFSLSYAVGRVARATRLSGVYDVPLVAAQEAKLAGHALQAGQYFLPNHPPFLDPYLALISGLPYPTAYGLFFLFLVLIAAACLPVLFQLLPGDEWPRPAVWLLGAGILLFEPLFISFLQGQDSALLLLGGVLWFLGVYRGHDRLAGLGLALTLIRPQIALLLAVPFLFRRIRVFAWFLAGTAVLAVYSLLQVGWSGALEYLHILMISASGAGYGLSEAGMFDLVGFLLRAAPSLGLGFIHNLGWGFYAAALVGLSLVWGLSRRLEVWQAVLAVSVSLMAAPHLHYHDLAFMAVGLLALAVAAVHSRRLTARSAAAIPITASVLLLLCDLVDPLRYSLPYLLLILLPIAALILGNRLEAH